MNRFGAIVCAAIVLCPSFVLRALAGSADGVSWTAMAVCDYRAVAAQHPDPKLRNRDYLATRLCDPVLLPHEYEAARDVIDVDPEAYAGYFFVNARTHHIDDLLDRAATDGITQVVILGAGFDSRAYRFSNAYPQIRFFEVDRPATIGAKERAVNRLLGSSPGYVRYVPIDFDTQSLEGALPGAGYDPAKKTLFILEGVTMYVTRAGNDATFEFIGNHSAPGSMVVFDYALRRVVEGDYTGLYGASRAAKGVAHVGTPFLTGWTPKEAADFARRHGLTILEQLDGSELTRRYLTGSDGKPDGRIGDWGYIIDARVR